MGYFRSVPALQLRMGKRFMDTLARPRLAKWGATGAGKDRVVGTPPSRRHGPALAAAIRAQEFLRGFLGTPTHGPFYACRHADVHRTRVRRPRLGTRCRRRTEAIPREPPAGPAATTICAS